MKGERLVIENPQDLEQRFRRICQNCVKASVLPSRQGIGHCH